jgi:hypothetical protein
LYSVCTSSFFISLSWLSCILPFCFYSLYTTQISMPSAGFEFAIPAIERQQNYTLDHTVTGRTWTLDHPACSYTVYATAALLRQWYT